MKLCKNSLILYGVTDRRLSKGKSLEKQVEDAVLGGTSIIQLREKGEITEEIFNEAEKIQDLCKKHDVPFIVNDNVDLALKLDADGVHVGQNDMNAKNVRKMLGSEKILGVSVQTSEQALSAQRDGADYLGVGAIFATNSKADAENISLKTLKEICSAVQIPVVAIGGINENNICSLAQSGICGVAVISALFADNDVKSAAARLRKKAEVVCCG